MQLILFGPPGAGKGTQAVAISEEFSLPHIATGDILRENVTRLTELGTLAKRYMDAGDLVPDELVIAMVSERIGRDDALEGFLLDGFPRTVAQAKALDDALARDRRAINAVIRLLVDDDELVSRLLRRAEEQGRSDDTREVIERRLAVYRKQTEPLVDLYHERGLLRDIDGEGGIAEVRERVFATVRDAGRST
jgi:adenylate kinase